MDETRIHPAQWTNGGDEVLCVKCVDRDGSSRGGFRWPLTVGATVEAQDWDPKPICGGGLHGWPWGFCIGEGKDPDWSGVWIVFGSKPEDVVWAEEGELAGKCKARRAIIRFVGTWGEATNFVLAGQITLIQHNSSGSASATGDNGSASASGDSGSASATGYRGSASASGDSGSASATGDSGSAVATGYSGSASATGYRGSASATGYSGSAVAGVSGKARAGKFGCIAIGYWRAERQEMRCAEIGVGDGSDGKLKANTWYRLDGAGKFKEER